MLHGKQRQRRVDRQRGPAASAAFLTLAMLASCSDDGGRSAPTTAAAVAAAPAAWFEETSEFAGLQFTHKTGHVEQYFAPEILSGGGALFDMDGDGDLDAYLVQGGGLLTPSEQREPNQLFQNLGSGIFENVTAGSGADVAGYGMGVAAGDYDNDSNVDLYITRIGPNVLLRNRGGGQFEDVTERAGVGDAGFGASAAFADLDADGDLDLFVVNYIRWSVESERECTSAAGKPDYCGPNSYQAPAQSVLYRNNGDGTFTDISTDAGLHRALGNGLGVLCADFSGDGRLDVFVANDQVPNTLWLNQGDLKFEDHSTLAGCAVDNTGNPKAGMGTASTDLDDDGDADLLVVNLRKEGDSFYRQHDGYFSDDTAAAGLAATSRPFTRFGVGFVDFDNDGFVDLYEASGRVERGEPLYGADPYAEPNLLFRGSVGGRLVEVQPRGGTPRPLIAASRAAAFGDVDNDGGIDILVVNRDSPAYLLRNVVRKRGHWIMFRVIEEHGRDAENASVMLNIAGRRIWREVRTAYSYFAANDPRVHVGLGSETVALNVVVKWVDGETESFGDFPADAVHLLRRGAGVGR